MAECFPEKLRWCWNEQVCQGVKCKTFEQSQGLDALLYKHVPLPLPCILNLVPLQVRSMLQAFPIGVPFKQFEELAKQADAETVDPRLKLILGVDRLDYTKGIIHRVRGFERLLDTYPEHLESVVLLQVCTGVFTVNATPVQDSEIESHYS